MSVSPHGSCERVLEAIPDAALAVAADGTIFRANARAEQLFGYAPGALAGCSHDLLVPAASRSPHRGGLAAFFADPARRPMAAGREIYALRADGSEFPAAYFLSPLDAGGFPLALAVVRHRTESQRVESELRSRAASYRQLFEANPHPMWVYDLETLRFLAVNEAAVRKYGYTRQEFLGMTLAHIRPPEDVDRLRANVAGVGSGLEEAGLWRHATKFGTLLDVEIVSHTLEWEGRRAELVLAQDVTERRPAEAALRESEHLHRTLLETLPHGVQENDCSGVITYSNRAHHRILGYDEGELVGKFIWHRHPTAEDQEVLRRYLAYLVETQPTPVPHVTRARRKDGSLVDLQVDWDYRRDSEGSLAGFLSIITDITERRRAEEDLQRRTRGLATLLDVSQSLAATLDLDRVLQATADGAARLFGLETAAVYLREGDDIHLRATAPPLPSAFPEVLRRGPLAQHPHLRESIASRSPVLLRDAAAAELTPAEEAAVRLRDLRTVLYLPLLAGEDPVGVLIVASTGEPREIPADEIGLCRTLANLAALAVANARLYRAGQEHAAELEQRVVERKRAEEERESLHAQLAHAQKLEAVGRLAGGVAHDFNNMLAVILGRAELALRRAGPESPLRRDLDEILQAAERSSVLTRQLLAFARRQTVSPQVLDLNAAVEGLLQMLRRLIGEDVELVWMPGAGAGNVRLDPSQLDQLLANLVVNARDAIAGTGRITLETRRVVFGEGRSARGEAVAPGEYALLAVADDGCGMDEETLAHLFEPFFTTKDPGRGTGLGLATVYGIVRQNGGFADVHSEPGRGASFLVYLPRVTEPGAQAGEAGAVGSELRGSETLLLVEDEEAILGLGQEILEGLGYTVLATPDPSEALRLAAAHAGEIHLLVTDVVMPGMNGRELAERLAGIRPGLRSLFVSGYTADVVAHRGVLDDGVRLLQKPFTVGQLAAAVREALEPRGGPRGRGGG